MRTVESLVQSFNGTRREKRRSRLSGALATGLALLLAATVGMLAVMRRALREAEANLTASHLNLAEALKAEGRANPATVYAAQSLATRDDVASRRFLAENPPATLLGVVPLAGGRALTRDPHRAHAAAYRDRHSDRSARAPARPHGCGRSTRVSSSNAPSRPARGEGSSQC